MPPWSVEARGMPARRGSGAAVESSHARWLAQRVARIWSKELRELVEPLWSSGADAATRAGLASS